MPGSIPWHSGIRPGDAVPSACAARRSRNAPTLGRTDLSMVIYNPATPSDAAKIKSKIGLAAEGHEL
ncbi:hypothetical protein QFZ41_000024 [Luteibacter sp. W1I16]|uniref:hypothetical protein n=1 Tax=Luteibacter sp. W1I16 TaxID=3373922 RepID=UPI003D201B28